MEVLRCSTPEEFLFETMSYRDLDPIRTNVLGSVASSVADDARVYDAHWWWLVKNDNGDVVGAAMRTAPFGLQIGPMTRDAAAQLAEAVATDDDEFPWLAGSEELVTTFLESYKNCHSPGSSRFATRGRMSVLYELKDLVVPRVEGSCRVATMNDFALVDQWTSDFHYFTEGVAREADERDQAALVAKVTEGGLTLWSVRGVIVAMAGRAAPVATPSGLVTRIGPVFTPAENRGRGYGSAVTASICEGLLAQGSRAILYADAENPTSNAVYQRIGFQMVDNVVQYDLGEA